MVKHLTALALLSLLCLTPALAYRQICADDTCHVGNPLPDFSPSAKPPRPWGSGEGGPIFDLTDYEPYRNADEGGFGVVLSTGGFQFTVTDLEIPGRGLPFQLSRTYRSKGDGERSVLGYNWHLSYDEYLTQGIYTDPGHVERPALEWTMGNGWTNVWVDYQSNGNFVPFLGFFGKLRAMGAGHGFKIRYADGTVKTFDQPATLNTKNLWLLTRIEDRNGNFITLAYSGDRTVDTITDTLGRKITLTYNPMTKRLASVTDFRQRTVEYNYSGAGDLISVRSPIVTATPDGIDDAFASGKTVTYHYLGEHCGQEWMQHNLESIVDAKSHTVVTNAYNATDGSCGPTGRTPIDAVDSQTFGTEIANQTITYRYTPLNPQGTITPNVATTQTEVTDRNGNIETHTFNAQGNPVNIIHHSYRKVGTEHVHLRTLKSGNAIPPQEIEEPDYTETNTYVDYGNNTGPMLATRHTEANGYNVDDLGNLVVYTGGMSEEYEYYDQNNTLADPDIFQKGNVLKIKRTAGARGAPGQEELTTQISYEPLFNQPIWIQDPRGHITKRIYDYQEGTYAQLTPVTPLDPVDHDWWTGSTQIQDFLAIPEVGNLGDKNGDGPIYQKHGNLISSSEGTVVDYAGNLSAEVVTKLVYNDFGNLTRREDAESNKTLFEYYSELDPDGNGTNTSPLPTDRTLTSGAGGYRSKTILKPDASDTAKDIELTVKYDIVGNVIERKDGREVRTDYVVNELNQVTRITRAAGVPTGSLTAFAYLEEFKYDANNNVSQHRIEQRDDVGQAITTAAARRWIKTTSAFDGLDRKVSATVETADTPIISLTTSYGYDNNGNLIKTTYPAGNIHLRQFDERDLLFREATLTNCPVGPQSPPHACTPDVFTADDALTSYDYDGSGNVIQVTDPGGHVTRSQYDGYNRKVLILDPALQGTRLTYDLNGNVMTKEIKGAVDGDSATPRVLSSQTFYYDLLNRLRRTDSQFFRWEKSGGPTTYTYTQTSLHSAHNAGLTSAADGIPANPDTVSTSLIAYDRLGNVVKTVDDNGHSTDTEYDGLGRIKRRLSNPVTIGAATAQNSIAIEYDKSGNMNQIDSKEYGIDRSGTSATVIGPLIYRVTVQNDSMNRPRNTTYVGRVNEGGTIYNYTTEVIYDSRGNKIQVTDPQGGRTKVNYDGLNRLLQTRAGYLWSGGAETTPLDGTANADHLITTTYEYNNNSQLKKIIDDSSQNTIYEYDNQGRPKKITYQDNSYKELTYNVDSLVTKWTQVKSSSADLVVNRQFDALHRLVQKDRVPSTPFVGTKQQLFQYDGLSRLTKAMDDLEPGDPINSQVEMSYDSFGDVLTEKQTAAYDEAAPATYLVTSEYNGVGFRTKLTYPGGRAIDYHPDELNRLESLDDEYLPQGSRTTSYDYLGGSKILNRRAPNNTSIRVTYDDAKRVVELAHSMTSGTPPYALPDFKYGYDIVGNRLSERRLHEPSTGSNKKGERYEYDVAYRLTKRREGSFDTNGAWQDTWPTALDYNLDGPGNWKTYLNGTSYTNTVNTLNQYSVFRGNGANRNLLYDLAGNLIRESMTAGGQTVYQQYSYDSSNRLNSYTDTSENATEYKYDALNRRIMKNWHASTYRRFVYDGGKLIEERDYYDNLMASYVYGAGGEILTRRHWFGGSSTDLFYHTNSLGSVTAVTDSAGEVKERYKYDSYGKATFVKPDFSASGSTSYLVVANNILFSGAYYDGESGNYYMWHREYDPYLGRFLQRDPLGEGESLNLYAYVHNNPINATDPTGLAQERGQTWFNLVTGGGGAGSRNIYCMAGLCGGGSASSPWPIGWTSSGAPIYAPSNQSSYFGSFAHLHDLTAARADVLHARAELGLPAGDPDRGMNGDGTQPSDGSNSGSRTGMDIWDSVSKRWSTVTETADMFSKDMNRAADILTQPLTDWLNRHCLMCPAPPSLFRPPAMKLGIIFLPFGGVAKGSMSLARELGAAGEAAVREAVEIGPATRVVVNGATRVPDGLTSTALSEVKNVGALSFTQQLRDYAQIAGEMEVRFDLYVRPGAALSGPLLEAEAAGIVNILPIPFK